MGKHQYLRNCWIFRELNQGFPLNLNEVDIELHNLIS